LSIAIINILALLLPLPATGSIAIATAVASCFAYSRHRVIAIVSYFRFVVIGLSVVPAQRASMLTITAIRHLALLSICFFIIIADCAICFSPLLLTGIIGYRRYRLLLLLRRDISLLLTFWFTGYLIFSHAIGDCCHGRLSLMSLLSSFTVNCCRLIVTERKRCLLSVIVITVIVVDIGVICY
jgi:hypothetical protein